MVRRKRGKDELAAIHAKGGQRRRWRVPPYGVRTSFGSLVLELPAGEKRVPVSHVPKGSHAAYVDTALYHSPDESEFGLFLEKLKAKGVKYRRVSPARIIGLDRIPKRDVDGFNRFLKDYDTKDLTILLLNSAEFDDIPGMNKDQEKWGKLSGKFSPNAHLSKDEPFKPIIFVRADEPDWGLNFKHEFGHYIDYLTDPKKYASSSEKERENRAWKFMEQVDDKSVQTAQKILKELSRRGSIKLEGLHVKWFAPSLSLDEFGGGGRNTAEGLAELEAIANDVKTSPRILPSESKRIKEYLDKGRMSPMLRNALLELDDALRRNDVGLASDLSVVKSYIGGGTDKPKVVAGLVQNFMEDEDYNEKVLGRSLYGYLDELNHTLAYRADIIPAGAVIAGVEGNSRVRLERSVPEGESPTLKEIKKEHIEIHRRANLR